MPNEVVQKILQKVFNAKTPSVDDIEFLLSLKHGEGLEDLYVFSKQVCNDFVGKGVLLRGIIEFSNYCKNTCHYCGINRNNTNLQRYRMSMQEVLNGVDNIYSKGIRTVVLQAGEDPAVSASWLSQIIEQIRAKYDMAITISFGEHSRQNYKLWKDAGAQRYLLKIESSDEMLYNSLHDGMLLNERLRCLEDLRDLGYQVGSGIIIGLKGQTLRNIAKDIVFFGKMNFDMVGIGPFIPHSATPLANEAHGDFQMVLKAVALSRIVTKNSHIPATTALGSLDRDYRIDALKVGANVIMPNFTQREYKKLYEIYPNKRCINESAGACVNCYEGMAKASGKYIDYSIGHSLKQKNKIILGKPL